MTEKHPVHLPEPDPAFANLLATTCLLCVMAGKQNNNAMNKLLINRAKNEPGEGPFIDSCRKACATCLPKPAPQQVISQTYAQYCRKGV